MSDPRLTAAQVRAFRDDADGIRDDYESRQLSGLHSRCSELSVVETIELCDSHEALRADVERLTAEHAALKTSDSQRVILEMLLSAIDTVLLGNEVSDFEESFPPVRQVIDLKDERDHLRAENAALRDLSYECLHDFTGNTGCGFGSNTPGDCPNCQRPLTPQTWRDRAMSAAAKIPHLMAENAALREERDAERAKRIVAEHNKMLSLLGRSSEQELREENLRTKLAETEIERDALKAELLRPLAWREGATIEKAERELAEARAEIAKLKDEKQFLFSELRNRPPSQFGIIGGPDAHKCPPSLMEDWRGANEDWRKEKG